MHSLRTFFNQSYLFAVRVIVVPNTLSLHVRGEKKCKPAMNVRRELEEAAEATTLLNTEVLACSCMAKSHLIHVDSEAAAENARACQTCN